MYVELEGSEGQLLTATYIGTGQALSLARNPDRSRETAGHRPVPYARNSTHVHHRQASDLHSLRSQTSALTARRTPIFQGQNVRERDGVRGKGRLGGKRGEVKLCRIWWALLCASTGHDVGQGERARDAGRQARGGTRGWMILHGI